MELTQVSYEVIGRVARVSMNRPRYKNAQSLRMLEELDAAFQIASDDPEVRVIVLRGEGDTFSAGHDLGTAEHFDDLRSRPYGGADAYSKMRIAWKEGIEFGLRWRDIPKPTIAAVQGFCIFNAWVGASVMDVIFAADNAQFLPDRVYFFVPPWDLGPRQAKEILFRHRFIGAREAHEIGFVNHVVPLTDLDAAVMAYANDVAEGDPAELWVCKMAVNQMMDQQGYSNYVRSAFAIDRMLSSESPSGPRDRIDGRTRSPLVQTALGRSPEARAMQ